MMLTTSPDDRIATIALDEATIIARNADIESEREVALRDLVEENEFRPLRAVANGHHGPWELRLSVVDSMLAVGIRDNAGEDAGTIGLGMGRLRRVIREYFAICDSYYKALRKATAAEIETLDMARRAIHDRGTRHLLNMLEGKIVTDFDTARRLFTLICVLHIKA
ncbi:UPF0262 family protein [Alteraurantiacibacter aquimixticola]|uniref:UPF0262 family protein n=1 Tax=Alteraurantiacibacter aquimixticola TaxID=2489173 RepID=A0A4V4U8R3_9SPHN|nr:UPF0262 family protein [Alteraurantiacibacter aquimixticola]TIX51017.1 UPF0262 family protein [Alteraurantiacibacter aquimixticola]